jgi:hypothetical protein
MNGERTLHLHVYFDSGDLPYQTSCGPNYTIKNARSEIREQFANYVPVLYDVQFFLAADRQRQHPIPLTEIWDARTHGGSRKNKPIIVIIRNLVKDFVRRAEGKKCPSVKEVFGLKEAFEDVDQYWIDLLPEPRFGWQQNNILYRPEIVNRMVADLNSLSTAEIPVGIMVEGLQGVGKSHSLVNLVRRLRFGDERQHYHVTFVPDCDRFERIGFLYEVICGSFGTNTSQDHLALPQGVGDWMVFNLFISAISSYMTECKKKWVFIFDQVNKVLSKRGVKKFTQLQFPESQIKQIMKPKKILSIISASANNQAALEHEGFKTFQHELQMSPDEILLAFPSLAGNDEVFDKCCDVTGRVPLQMSKLVAAGFNEESYKQAATRDIVLSLTTLHDKNASTSKNYIKSALSCVLRTENGDAVFYDRKHLVRDTTVAGVQYKAAFPAVLLAYYDYYFDQIMENLDEILSSIARTWAMQDISGAERGWIFERGVIATCKKNRNINFTGGETIPSPLNVSLQKIFESQRLPPKDFMVDEGMYVPKNSNFPAIDFIWKQENIVVAVQAHVSARHDVVVSTFQDMLDKETSWGEFDRVILLYLSPSDETAKKMGEKVVTEALSYPTLEVVVASLSEFTTSTGGTPLSNFFPKQSD